MTYTGTCHKCGLPYTALVFAGQTFAGLCGSCAEGKGATHYLNQLFVDSAGQSHPAGWYAFDPVLRMWDGPYQTQAGAQKAADAFLRESNKTDTTNTSSLKGTWQ